MITVTPAPKPYDFQVELVERLSHQANVLIGDDMGLGKTVEAILLDRVRREDPPTSWPARTLVLTYSSVTSSWVDHFKIWNPKLRVFEMDPKNRDAFIIAARDGTHDVFIMHWEALRLVIEQLKKLRWLHVVADECQKIKNRKTQVTIAINKLRTTYKTAMSGTPADNAPQDLWAILNWLYPNTWRSYWAYFNKYVLFKGHDTSKGGCAACLMDGEVKVHRTAFREVIGVAEKDELHAQLKPFYMRRLKEEVLQDLPEKYYSERETTMTPQQRRAYDQMASQMLAWVGENEDQPLAAPVVIAKLVRLQQFGVAYGEIVKVRRRLSADRIEDKKAYYVAHGMPWTKEDEYEIVDALKLTEPSGKLDEVMTILGEMDSREPLSVFSMSKQAIYLLGKRLSEAGISHGLLTGDTPQSERGPLVSKFQSGKLRVFGGTIKAGGVGITLTRASTCVFLDRAWSPSVNRQAEDRHHRIGQRNAVHIIDLIAKGTIDLGRLQRIEQKWGFLKELLGDPKEVKKKLEKGVIK